MGPKSLYLAIPLVFSSADGGPLGRSPWNFLWMSKDGQGTKCRRNIAENFNRMSRAHERCRRPTDDRRTGDSKNGSRGPVYAPVKGVLWSEGEHLIRVLSRVPDSCEIGLKFSISAA